MDYIEFKIPSNTDFNDIIVAELGEIGFDTFEETASELKAYIQESEFSEEKLKEVEEKYSGVIDFNYQITKIPKVNWNEEWEKSFSPVEVENKVYIRASFHEPKPGFEYEIVINPKMSFGTGHHDTTYQMVLQQLDINHKQKRVLDMGAGTGILAIMAEKLGSNDILAIDIDEWSVENGIENVDLNNCNHIRFIKGDANSIENENKFDIILANINLNVLKNDISVYANKLNKDGFLVMSGFYEHDIDELKKVAENCGMKLEKAISKNNWASLTFTFNN